MKARSRRDFLRRTASVLGSGAALLSAGCAIGERGRSPRGKKGSPIQYGMVIDLRKCIGCQACTTACKAENKTPPGIFYNIVMEEETGQYPLVRRTFLPKNCMQCQRSSCSLVCPVKATYVREDGIVMVDYDRCIGCRYCITACPYGARAFDFGDFYNHPPTAFELAPSVEYGEGRRRQQGKSPIGGIRKCHFCIHRIEKGLEPSCIPVCLGGARYFGNLNEPEGKLQRLIISRSHMRLKEELGNEPSVYYLL